MGNWTKPKDTMPMPLDAENALSDEILVARYAAGDRAAARILTLRLTPRILGYAIRHLGGDRAEAEDVTQESLLRLWRGAQDWPANSVQVLPWLYRVAGNLCIDRIRARVRRRSSPLDEAPDLADAGIGVEAQMIAGDRLTALDQALACLPERQRQAVVLRHIEGLTNPEIATVMDIGVEAVESLTARGKRALVAVLSARQAELGYDGEGV